MWSLACMVFELLIGDFLFEPRKGHNYSKSDDHLAQIIEMLGPMPESFAFAGRQFNKYFGKESEDDRFYSFRRIKGLRHVPIKKLLTDKYRYKDHEAEVLADFLSQMLKWHPHERASAQKMLDHPWLSMEPSYDYKYTDLEFKKI